ncbi:MAG: nuclear transport factor 2 family protein [Chitinophagaceae bacterium]
MKALTTSILFSLSFIFVTAQEQNLTPTPLSIVNKRMAFYNQHNFTEFIKLYSPDVEIYTYPNSLLGTGTDNLTSIFKPKFIAKSIKVEIISQMFNGNYVINHEIVSENKIQTKYISIYEVKDGLIRSVKFVRN